MCTVKSTDGLICGIKEFKGQYSINLKKHLKTCHTDTYKYFEAAEIEKTKEKERRVSSSQLKQSSLPIHSLGSKLCNPNSNKHKTIIHFIL